MKNPFGLVYQDTITENKENEVNIQKNNLHLRQHKSISKPIHTTTIQQRKQISGNNSSTPQRWMQRTSNRTIRTKTSTRRICYNSM